MIVRQIEPHHTPQLIPILIPIIYKLYSSQRLVNLAANAADFAISNSYIILHLR